LVVLVAADLVTTWSCLSNTFLFTFSIEGRIFEIYTADGGKTTIHNYQGGDNSFEETLMAKPQVTKVVVTFMHSGAITGIKTFDCVDESDFVG